MGQLHTRIIASWASNIDVLPLHHPLPPVTTEPPCQSILQSNLSYPSPSLSATRSRGNWCHGRRIMSMCYMDTEDSFIRSGHAYGVLSVVSPLLADTDTSFMAGCLRPTQRDWSVHPSHTVHEINQNSQYPHPLPRSPVLRHPHPPASLPDPLPILLLLRCGSDSTDITRQGGAHCQPIERCSLLEL